MESTIGLTWSTSDPCHVPILPVTRIEQISASLHHASRDTQPVDFFRIKIVISFVWINSEWRAVWMTDLNEWLSHWMDEWFAIKSVSRNTHTQRGLTTGLRLGLFCLCIVGVLHLGCCTKIGSVTVYHFYRHVTHTSCEWSWKAFLILSISFWWLKSSQLSGPPGSWDFMYWMWHLREVMRAKNFFFSLTFAPPKKNLYPQSLLSQLMNMIIRQRYAVRELTDSGCVCVCDSLCWVLGGDGGAEVGPIQQPSSSIPSWLCDALWEVLGSAWVMLCVLHIVSDCLSQWESSSSSSYAAYDMICFSRSLSCTNVSLL